MGLTEKGLKKAENHCHDIKAVLTGDGCRRQGNETVFRCKAEPGSEVELVVYSPKGKKELHRCPIEADLFRREAPIFLK